MATKTSVPYAALVVPTGWPPELAELDSRIRDCVNERNRAALIQQRKRILSNVALFRWHNKCSALPIAHGSSWKFMRSIYAPRPNACPLITQNDHPLTARQHANASARLYKSKSIKVSQAPLLIPFPCPSLPAGFSMAELEAGLYDLSQGTAAGNGNIYCESRRKLSMLGKRKVLQLFFMCYRSGHIPEEWRKGSIISLLKPNKPASDLSSFREVTLTSTLCKLMERLVARRLRDEIETKLQPQHARFRPNRSTADALVQITTTMKRPTQDSRTAAAFVDYARVFDSVDHGRITVSLQSLGVNPAFQC